MTRLLLLALLITIGSCNEDPIVEEEQMLPYPGVDDRLWPYFERFELEGEQRGITLNLNTLNIQGRIESIDEEHIAGTCQFRGTSPRLVTIDSEFWNRSSDLFREFIVFHELGHCALRRDHDESASSSGVCLSIMRSGTTDCFDQYSVNTRAYYLDELFSKKGGI
ncbi:MAG: hypothetical protein HKN68_13545 [Saprospiraceae bacterium]|nr:hypothetical protein [Saprospiraceae bacterium]